MKLSPVDVAHVRSYVLALPALDVTGISVPHNTLPSPVYVRSDLPRPPAPEFLTVVVRCLRGSSLDCRRDAVALVGTLFNEMWEGKLPNIDAKVVDDILDVKDSRARWDRAVTPMFTSDTLKLNGEALGVFLSGPVLIAAELKRKIAEAVTRNPTADLSKLELYYTPPKIHVNLNAFWLEAFSWVESAGYLPLPEAK